MSLTSCASLKPPAELLQDCSITYLNPTTNGDLALEDKAREADLKRCNADKAALRVWAGVN